MLVGFKKSGIRLSSSVLSGSLGVRSTKRNFSIDPHLIVSTCTDSLQYIHTATGIPWWGLIPLSTFALRSVWTLPLAILQRKRIQKQNEYKPLINAMYPVFKLKLAERVNRAKKRALDLAKEETSISGGSVSEKEAAAAAVSVGSPVMNMKYEEIVLLANKERRKRQKEIFKAHNIQIWKNFVLPAFQIPLWVMMSLTMRDLSGWSSWDSLANKALDPALYTEGLLWFTDLTSYDPIHVFPVMLGVVSLCNVEWTFKTLELMRTGSNTNTKTLRPTLMDSIGNISRLSVVFMMAISMNAPVALTLYWLSSQIFSLIQNIFLDINFPMSFTPRKRFNFKEVRDGDQVDVIRKGSAEFSSIVDK